MKLKLMMAFIGVVLILLMLGVGIVSGDDDAGYPSPIEIQEPDYPEPDSEVPDGFYITSTPVPQPKIYIDDGGYPVWESADYSSGYPMIEPQYVNGRNLWEEIVFQFWKLLELMK